MRTIVELVAHLRSLDVQLWAEGRHLHLNAPKGVLTPTLRAELTEHKAEVLALLSQAHLAPQTVFSPIEPVRRGKHLPLSFAQQRLWFLEQLEGESAVYNITRALCLKGSLNVAALERSLTEIIRRHETLRTTFAARYGSPVQVIAQPETMSLSIRDLQELPEADQPAAVQRLAAEGAQQPFDLVRGPLLRVTLLRLDATDHVLLVTMHHIVSDAWSMTIFMRELSTLYGTVLSGRPSPLPDLPIQYADFAHWQRQWLQGDTLETLLSYWKQQLAGAPPVLELPTDHSRPPVQTFRGSTEQFLLSPDLTRRLEALSQRAGVTLFMTLLAAFVTLLAHDSGREDIVVGFPIANRNRKEIESVIGFFVNTLVLRIKLSGNPTFLEMLNRVREVALGAYDHQDMPFEKLVEALHPERDLSRTPLCQVMFILQNASLGELKLSGLIVTPLEFDDATSKFDLTLSMEETEKSLIGAMKYNTDLFDRATIARMVGHFQILLASIVAGPEQRLSELPFLTEAERQQLLVEWNNTKADRPQDQCLHHLFEAQVERMPDAIAVVFEDQQLTYRQLNQRANQLAHYLQTLDVGPEVLVGMCMERSLELVVGMLGVLKAGGAYVPFDPAYPNERLTFMLEDSQAPVLLTQRTLAGRFPEHKARPVYLDTSWDVIGRYHSENPVSGVMIDNPAYVIYTSGSTGRPKGTVITHRAICNHMLWMQDKFPLTEADSVLQKTPVSFDASVWEFYAPLLAGARLIVAKPGGHMDSSYLIRLITDQNVTILQLVPTLLQLLLRDKEFETCRCLKRVFCGGEALSPALIKRFYACLPASLYNLYGPTEATIDATIWPCSCADDRRIAPIGRPIDNMQAYILDSHLRPEPIGIPGELYLGGVGLARGYLNRPQLTAQRFIPDPFSQQAGARLYKTGDLARYLPDGNIEFLGRMDYQVKVRGLRIELGEIEIILGQHPAVQEAVVLAQEDLPGGKQLVAYLVANCVPRPTVNELRNFLQEKLPDYMVPSIYMFLDALPLMPNGKVDRRSLPVPDMGQPHLLRPYVAPTNPTQELLVDIWAKIFEIEQVGIDDDFFELGGHSLLAAQLIFLVRETFQIDLPLRTFLENPTIVGLAQAIAAFRQAGPAIAMTATTSPDLKAEAVLDPSIRPKTVIESSMARRTEAHSIFLTGGTGFLGTFLLYELLQQTQADIYCLVRAPDVEAGQQRIRKSLEAYSHWQQSFGSRIVPVAGDLSQPFLGLSVRQFQALAGRIDAIYHNGALVNFVYPYHELKPTNVLGTQEVLRLATQSKAVPVHHISTISVFNLSSYHRGRPIGEEKELDHNQGLQVGYAQSKWVAEKLVTEARGRGLPVCIYRLGTVAGDSRTGGWKTDDYVCRFIKGCIQLGSIPDQEGAWRLAPVDYVSQAIVYLSRQPTTTGKVFNLIAPHRLDLSQLADWIRAFGYKLRSSSYQRWLADLSEAMRHLPEHPLYSLLPLLKERRAAAEGDLQFECQNVVEGLAGTSIVCPPIDARLLGTYFSYFVRSGFLDAPPPGGMIKYHLRGANGAISATVEGTECS